MRISEKIKQWLFIVAAFLLVFNACSVEAKSLKKGEVYQTLDENNIIRIISHNELEIEKRGDILVASYAVDDKTVRVVFTVLGTKTAQYYEIIREGLQDRKHGTILYSRKQYEIAKHKAEEDRKIKLNSGIDVENALHLVFEVEEFGNKDTKEKKIPEFFDVLEIIENKMKEYTNVYYGIYPWGEAKNIFFLQSTLFDKSKLVDLKIKRGNITITPILLEERTIKGKIAFLFKGGGLLIQIQIKSPIDPIKLKKRLLLSSNSYIQNFSSRHNFLIWISKNDYSKFGNSKQKMRLFLHKKLGKKEDYVIVRIVNIHSRYNSNSYVQ